VSARHAILGNGNLGAALVKECLARDLGFKVFSTTTGWKYPADLQRIHDYRPDHVWVTVGAGSVEQASADYRPFLDLHVRLPMELAQTLNSSVNLHLFSTDYCEVGAQSLYALSKKYMEDSILMLERPHTFIYRVGSLYGTAKPQKCFPYKLKKNSVTGKAIALPTNCVCPTPTDWLARRLMALETPELLPTSIRPSDCVTVKEWGELILGCEVTEAPMDTSRPTICTHGITNEPSWRYLWGERENN